MLGGGIGSGLRYLLGKWLNPVFSGFYLGTFLANVVGCLLIGFLLGLAMRSATTHPVQTALFATGFCGGFTTFSTFALEQFLLHREGSYPALLFYTLASLAAGFLAVGLGFWATRWF